MVGSENADVATVFAWLSNPQFGVGFEYVDFACVFAWFSEGHLGSFGVISWGYLGHLRANYRHLKVLWESSEGHRRVIWGSSGVIWLLS